MALLTKVKASTLMETLVATVLIVVIFMMSSLLLNSIFLSSIRGNTQPVQERLQQLEYKYKNGIVAVPYYEEWENWQIEIIPQDNQGSEYIVLEALENTTQKSIKSYLIIEE